MLVCCSVVQLDPSHTPEPRHVLSRHSLPITDIHCGLMGAQARVTTASLDQTVKVSPELQATQSVALLATTHTLKHSQILAHRQSQPTAAHAKNSSSLQNSDFS